MNENTGTAQLWHMIHSVHFLALTYTKAKVLHFRQCSGSLEDKIRSFSRHRSLQPIRRVLTKYDLVSRRASVRNVLIREDVLFFLGYKSEAARLYYNGWRPRVEWAQCVHNRSGEWIKWYFQYYIIYEWLKISRRRTTQLPWLKCSANAVDSNGDTERSL